MYGDCGLQAVPPEQQQNVRYFIATDTQKGRDAAARVFGDRVLFYKDFMVSNNPKGVQQALTDILLLAAAQV